MKKLLVCDWLKTVQLCKKCKHCYKLHIVVLDYDWLKEVNNPF